MAQSGKRTILVDADLRRPNAHRMLDADLEPGVAEILNGTADSDLRDHVRSTEVERLHLLPAGRTEVPPAEALDSDRMKNLIDRFRDEYDIVIVDSPPVLAVSDPVLLSTHADATLLVVSADRTDLRAVEVTEKTLNAVDVPISGVIFNQFDESKRRGYGYGYDYKKTYEYALDE
jgi:capsular exopolysaccharide synthesis family protein